MDKINDLEIYENDIDLYIHEFFKTDDDEKIRAASQNVWCACMTYIGKKLFRGTRVLKDPHGMHNEYDYELCKEIADIYIYYCNLYDKDISIYTYSSLTGIDKDNIYNNWGGCKVTDPRFMIYKILTEGGEAAKRSRLYTGNKNPVGIIALLNHDNGYNSPYSNAPAKRSEALTADNLPRLSVNGGHNDDGTQ